MPRPPLTRLVYACASVDTDECIHTDMADTFTEGLERLLSYESDAHNEWRAHLGEKFKFINAAARWGRGALERNEDVMGNFSAVESFLRQFKDDDGLPCRAAERLVVSVPYAAVNPCPLVKTEVQPLKTRAFPH